MLQKHYDLYFKRLSHSEQAFFYRYNDIEKNYLKKSRKSKRRYNSSIKPGKKEFHVNFRKVKYVLYE